MENWLVKHLFILWKNMLLSSINEDLYGRYQS